jgi:hypothetical protein
MKEIKKKIKSPLFFISMATVAKFVLPIPIFFGLSRSTKCGCDRKHGNSSYSSFSFFLPSKVCPTHFSKMP